ncbi:helix-turn-helix transcriptional regulator [Priestia megaterium]|jgi:putative transcriptional regulator|uniref:helix-turn-helix transcriptional regulator n=1 Tax=Priestia megaterium TaxID=1404 RepID=UPI00310151D8
MKNKAGNRVKELREEFGFTQQELAEKVGVTRLTIGSMERKKYEPFVGTAIKLARVFNCKVEDIFWVGEEE